MKPAGFTLKSLHADKEEIRALRQQLAETQVFEALWTGAC